MEMRGKRESGSREEAELSQETGKEELRVTGSPIRSGMTEEERGSGMTKERWSGIPKADSESGRSMVETLGVLAIMGVLAIGGIAGYRYAVDKYNANEILNEVRKRAVMVSQQRILNQPIDLSEYGDNTIQGHTVTTTESYNGSASFFALTVLGVEKDICNQVIKEKIQFVVEEKVGEVVVEENTTCAEGNNDITFAFKNTLEEGVDLRCEGIVCPEGTACQSGRCLCPNNWEKCGDICCQEGEICTTSGTAKNSQCYTAEGECTRNEDCKTSDGKIDSTKYCAFENPTSCDNPGTGTCRDKGVDRTKENAIALDLNSDGQTDTYVWKGPSMTWWSAKNWCIAHNKKLNKINAKTLNCYQTNGEPASEQYVWLCCAPNATDCALGNYNRSSSMRELHRKVGGYYYWTDQDNGACHAYFLNIAEGVVQNHFSKDSTRANALCD